MTTKVTVDAHAGWPVKVTRIVLGQDGLPLPEHGSEVVVPANTKEDFYVHSHMRIAVEEMPREKQVLTSADVGSVSDVLGGV